MQNRKESLNIVLVTSDNWDWQNAKRAIADRNHRVYASDWGRTRPQDAIHATTRPYCINGVDAIITDLYIDQEPAGLAVVLACYDAGIPCVVRAEENWWLEMILKRHDISTASTWAEAVERLEEMKISRPAGHLRQLPRRRVT